MGIFPMYTHADTSHIQVYNACIHDSTSYYTNDNVLLISEYSIIATTNTIYTHALLYNKGKDTASKESLLVTR